MKIEDEIIRLTKCALVEGRFWRNPQKVSSVRIAMMEVQGCEECGEKPWWFFTGEGRGRFYVQCNCVTKKAGTGGTIKVAIARWNALPRKHK